MKASVRRIFDQVTVSPEVHAAFEAICLERAAAQYGDEFFKNNASPDSIFEHRVIAMSPEDAEFILAALETQRLVFGSLNDYDMSPNRQRRN